MTDPLCPWAYSFEPVMRALEARYGDQLEVRTVLIGLVSTVEESLARGSSAEGRALTSLRFRRFGMPITPHVRERVIASAPACRLVKAAGLQGEAHAAALLRALRFAWFTTPLLLDEDDALSEVCDWVSGLDVDEAMRAFRGDAARAAYEADRIEARTASPVAVALGRTSRSDGPVRHTAPTLIFRAQDGRTAVVPGFQPFEAVEVALMNLEPRLTRLPVPDLPHLLHAYPGGLTSQEIARVLADTTAPVDRPATEIALTRLVGEGRAHRSALGDDALWTSS
ncbi:MAG: DsbA family protein [Solirubrobacteraceae bacterium]|nr:DsbA family protein [Solirubrobacteraceae bacterium]